MPFAFLSKDTEGYHRHVCPLQMVIQSHTCPIVRPFIEEKGHCRFLRTCQSGKAVPTCPVVYCVVSVVDKIKGPTFFSTPPPPPTPPTSPSHPRPAPLYNCTHSLGPSLGVSMSLAVGPWTGIVFATKARHLVSSLNFA